MWDYKLTKADIKWVHQALVAHYNEDVDSDACKALVMMFERAKQCHLSDKNMDARYLGSRGGKARADALSSNRRSEIASIAAEARWNKNRTKA